MTQAARTYPPEAYAPDGAPWWLLKKHPDTNRVYGDERRLAAWLAFNVAIDDTFTMRDLRTVLGNPRVPNMKEHLNRRLRELRKDGWVIFSNGDEKALPVDAYRLKEQGWHPGLGSKRPARLKPSDRLRKIVLERDGRRCVVCGVGSREPYPGEPNTLAQITVGHRVPLFRDSRAATADELQAECQRCNEPIRDQAPDPLTFPEVLTQVRALSHSDRDLLLRWLAVGHRLRSRLDEVYDLVRRLTPNERETVARHLSERRRG